MRQPGHTCSTTWVWPLTDATTRADRPLSVALLGSARDVRSSATMSARPRSLAIMSGGGLAERWGPSLGEER